MAENLYHYKADENGESVPVFDYPTISGQVVIDHVRRNVLSSRKQLLTPLAKERTRDFLRVLHDFIDDYVAYDEDELLHAFDISPCELFDFLWTAASTDQKLEAAEWLLTDDSFDDMQVPAEYFRDILERTLFDGLRADA